MVNAKGAGVVNAQGAGVVNAKGVGRVTARGADPANADGAGTITTDAAVTAFVRGATERYGRFWRKSAREPGAERELAQTALDRLQKLQLIVRDADRIRALPAIARFALGDAELQPTAARSRRETGSLF